MYCTIECLINNIKFNENYLIKINLIKLKNIIILISYNNIKKFNLFNLTSSYRLSIVSKYKKI